MHELYKRVEIQNKQRYRNALDKISILWMELPCKPSKQIAFNTKPKIEEHMLVVMDKSTHEEHLTQSLQTNIKQFKITVTFQMFITVVSMLRTGITNSISSKQSPIKMVINKVSYPLVLTRSKIWIMKSRGLLLMKNITPNRIIHF